MESIEAANNLLAVPIILGGLPASSMTASPSPGQDNTNQPTTDDHDQVARTAASDAIFTAIDAPADAGRNEFLFSSLASAQNGSSPFLGDEGLTQASKGAPAQSLIPGDPFVNPVDSDTKTPDKKHPPAPQNQGANALNNAAAAAGGGAGNLGTSTGTNSGGGGGGGGGGGSSPVGGGLATLANEGAFGPALTGHSIGATATPSLQGQGQAHATVQGSASVPGGPASGADSVVDRGSGSGTGSANNFERDPGNGSVNRSTGGVGSGSGTGSAGGGGVKSQVVLVGAQNATGSGSGVGSGSGSSPTTILTGTGTTFGALEGGQSGSAENSSVGYNAPVQGTAGVALTNVTVVRFGDNNSLSQAGDFTATIDWGDNTPTSAGSITAAPGGGYNVAGSHTYTAAGAYGLQVTIREVDTGTTTTSTAQVVINDAVLTASPVSVTATEGTAANNVTVATFTAANTYAPASSFSATIDWGDGTEPSSGTITGQNGNFTVTGSHSYAEGGPYQPTVTITSQGGSTAEVATTATVTDLPLSGAQLTVTPALTGSSTTLAANFTDANTSEDPSEYLAQIDWGDGTTDDATVSGSAGSYNFTGSHVYDHPGNYSITITVTDAGGATLTQSVNATITAAGMSASGATLSATAGQALSAAPLAAFTDGNTDDMNDWYGLASGYTATIDWGDGTGPDSSATLSGDPTGFYVMGTHTYTTPGAYTATVTITNSDGVSTTTTSTIDVSTMTPTGTSFNASEGIAVNNVTVATFTDTQSGTYTATIDWGDGTTPTSGTVSGSGGDYSVTGSHTYADGGTYPVIVTITNAGGLTALATGTADVADAALTASPQTITTPQNSPLTDAVVATFTDANGNDSLDAYSASIDWGDGSPTDVGTINYGNGGYTVTGSHTYDSQGSFTVTVSIGDNGGATTTASSTVTVTAPVINATAVSLSAEEGLALNDATVATFTAPGQYSDYTATIDWGDGTTDTGTVTGSGGNFSVTGTHTYTQPTDGQQYLVTVTITDTAGDTATALSSATVDGGALSATGNAVQTTEGSATSLTLATFTDTDPSYNADEFTAMVDWGDGTQDFATVSGSNGFYSVIDTHAYADEGTKTATVTITDPNGASSQTVTATVTVADAALSASPDMVQAAQGAALVGVDVAEFDDQDANDPATNYTATIDWGDGNSSAGVVSGGDGVFTVLGSHTYTGTGDFSIQVTITDVGGSQAVTTNSVWVAAAPVYNVASFSDTNPNDTAGLFQATINWGDGSATPSGTIQGGSGYFYVSGTHVYPENGSYAVAVTITGPGGPITINSTAQVSDVPLLSSAPPPVPVSPFAPPADEVPEISYNFSTGGIGGLLKNVTAASQPGLRIHLDDDFYNNGEFDTNSIVADYQLNTISRIDQNLVPGTISIGPANTQGTLTWSVPNSIRLWWQPDPNGPWQVVKSGGIPKSLSG